MAVSCFETPSLRISGVRQPVRMVDVVEAEAALDAEPVLVRRAVAALDGDDAVVLDLVGELAADAAIRADAVDLAVGRVGVTRPRSSTRLFSISAPVGQACTHSPQATQVRRAHRVVEVEDDLLEWPPRRHADDVVDLDLAAGADAELAVDAGVELHRHRRMAEVVGCPRAAHDGKAAVCDGDPVRPASRRRSSDRGRPRVRAGRSREARRRACARFGALGRGLNLHAGRRAGARRRRRARARPRSRPCRRGSCRPAGSRARAGSTDAGSRCRAGSRPARWSRQDAPRPLVRRERT